MARALGLGFLVGFPIAAAPGPMFVLVLRRTLAHGWRSGLISGLGIATGDAIYAAVAAFGVAAITNLLIAQRRWVALAGGVALAVIGVRALLQKGPQTGGATGMVGSYGSTVALTLTNPPTVLSFAAIFAGLGPRVGLGWSETVALVVGVMLGSAVWWVVVTLIATQIRERVTPRIMRGVGIASSALLVGFGIVMAVQAI